MKVDLRQVPRIKVKFLWHDNWWDGPLEGVCEYQGKRYWYHYHHENYKKTAKYWRRYGVFKMTPEELAEEEKWNGLFVACVGNHFQCDENGRRNGEGVKPQHLWNEFYDAFKGYERPHYEEKQDRVIGFFDL